MLEQHGTAEGDRVLATLARLSGLMFQASQLINRLKDGHDEDRLVMLASIQTELAQIEAKLLASVSSAGERPSLH